MMSQEGLVRVKRMRMSFDSLTLDSLPMEILNLIAGNLDTYDRMCFFAACKRFNALKSFRNASYSLSYSLEMERSVLEFNRVTAISVDFGLIDGSMIMKFVSSLPATLLRLITVDSEVRDTYPMYSFDEFPESIEELTLSCGYWNMNEDFYPRGGTLKRFRNLKKLRLLGHKCYVVLCKDDIPNVTHLTLGCVAMTHYIERTAEDFLEIVPGAPQVSYLCLYPTGDFLQNIFPSDLEYLDMSRLESFYLLHPTNAFPSRRFDIVITPSVLPGEKLETVIMPSVYDHDITEKIFPDSVKRLHIGEDYSRMINGTSHSANLEILSVPCLMDIIEPYTIPSSVNTLNLVFTGTDGMNFWDSGYITENIQLITVYDYEGQYLGRNSVPATVDVFGIIQTAIDFNVDAFSKNTKIFFEEGIEIDQIMGRDTKEAMQMANNVTLIQGENARCVLERRWKENSGVSNTHRIYFVRCIGEFVGSLVF